MKNKGRKDILLAPVDVESLIDKLSFSEEDLVRAVRVQAGLFFEASRYRVKKMRTRLRAEAVHETLAAEAAMHFRRGNRKTDGKRALTESAVKDQVLVQREVVAARRELDAAMVSEEFAKLLVDAFRHRKDACRILGELAVSESSADLRVLRSDSEAKQLQKLRDQLDERFPGKDEEG